MISDVDKFLYLSGEKQGARGSKLGARSSERSNDSALAEETKCSEDSAIAERKRESKICIMLQEIKNPEL